MTTKTKDFRNKGEGHPAFKHGNTKRNQTKYREQAIEIHGEICFYCGKTSKETYLDVHHIDENPQNDPPDGSNWMILCKSCHSKEHWKKRKKFSSYKEAQNFHMRKRRNQKKLTQIKEAKNLLSCDSVIKTMELSKIIGISRQRIHLLRKRKRISFCKIGGIYFYPKDFKILKSASKMTLEEKIAITKSRLY